MDVGEWSEGGEKEEYIFTVYNISHFVFIRSDNLKKIWHKISIQLRAEVLN